MNLTEKSQSTNGEKTEAHVKGRCGGSPIKRTAMGSPTRNATRYPASNLLSDSSDEAVSARFVKNSTAVDDSSCDSVTVDVPHIAGSFQTCRFMASKFRKEKKEVPYITVTEWHGSSARWGAFPGFAGQAP
jgi:hypothetical protein